MWVSTQREMWKRHRAGQLHFSYVFLANPPFFAYAVIGNTFHLTCNCYLFTPKRYLNQYSLIEFPNKFSNFIGHNLKYKI